MIAHNLLEYIIETLIKYNLTIATCESVTGGKIIAYLVDIPGASKVVRGAIVAYQNEIKIKNVGVKKNTVERYGVVSQNVAYEMANGICQKLISDIGIAITGIAEINEQYNIPVAYLSIKIVDKLYSYKLTSNEKKRNDIRLDFALQSLTCLQKLLEGMDK
jgi:nicotinamide-nucleotide amidase